MVTEGSSSGYRSLSERKLTDDELLSPRFGVRSILVAIPMKTECASVKNDQSEALRGNSTAIALLVLDGRYRSVKFDGSVQATTKTVEVPGPNVRLGPNNDVAVINGASKRTTEHDGEVKSDYEKERSSGRSTRRDDRPVSEAGHTSTSDRLSGRSYARSHRGTDYGQRQFGDNYDRRGSRTVQRSRAEERTSGRGDRLSRYVQSASSSSDGHQHEGTDRRSGRGQRMYDGNESRTVLPRRPRNVTAEI